MENISNKVWSALVAAAGSYAERGWYVFRTGIPLSANGLSSEAVG